jgi:acetoin utilization deacetylase AcuC-like enzyme
MKHLKTGIVKDIRFLNHEPGDFHPESPARLEAIYRRLEMSDIAGVYQEIAPYYATKKEIALIHTKEYIRFIEATQGKKVGLDADTITSPLSYETACLAVGGGINLLKAIFSGEINNGFALIRPPGHHAEKDRAMGFCLFNNIAIAAKYALEQGWAKRILIVDWDVHHGNGTQHAFYNTKDVLYFSIHQYPHYPMTGRLEEIGDEEGRGFTVNVPLTAGYGDKDYLYIFLHLLCPIARKFEPDLILVSAGFDPYSEDPLGGMQVTIYGFASMAYVLKDLAAKLGHNRLALFLEGGYHLEGMARAVEAIIKVLLGETINLPDFSQYQPSPEIEQIIKWHKKNGWWVLNNNKTDT